MEDHRRKIKAHRRMYLLVCMNRSDYPANKVYWRPHCAGYTTELSEAGYYHADQLYLCNGKNGDWIIEPTWDVYV